MILGYNILTGWDGPWWKPTRSLSLVVQEVTSVVWRRACWPLVPKFAGSNPAEAVGFFGRKNPQCAFLRRGSKAVGPMSFTACKRTQKWRGSCHFRQNSQQFLVCISTFRYWGSLASFQTWGTSGGGNWNVLITGLPSWGFDVLLATTL